MLETFSNSIKQFTIQKKKLSLNFFQMSKPTPEALNLVKSLMELPENNLCADCQHKVAKWASSTLGVFICIDCSGIHRNLGTHITFVRSCTLDSWTPDQARVMKRVGNKIANEYWESRLPPDFIRPSSTDRVNMEAFIRAKYVQKLWAAPGEPPHLRTNFRPSGVSSGQKPSVSMYNGYFQHNPMSGNQLVFGVNQPKKKMSISRSTDSFDYNRKPASGPSMDLADFMNMMNNSGNQNDESSEKNDTFQSQSVGLEHVSSSPLAIQDPIPEGPKKNNVESTDSAPKLVPAKSEIPKAPSSDLPPNNDNNAPPAKPVASTPSFPLTGSTAHDIMMAAQNEPKNKLPKFAKRKGVARFAKRPTNDAVFDQMLQMSENTNRPESAPVHMLLPNAEKELTV